MKKKYPLRTILTAGAVLVVAFLVLGAVSVAGWEYSNSNYFCSTACHAVHPEETFAHQSSHHANVDCVECHIGRLSTFRAMLEKSGHIVHAWTFFAGYERPLYAPSFAGAQESCEGCHTQEPHRHNTVNAYTRFGSDRRNTEKKLTMTVRLNGRTFGGEERRDIDWHSSGAVRYISDDPQNQQIRWVEATQPDGSTLVYSNVAAPLGEAEINEADKQVMDCADCHNRAGHPFRDPEEEIDRALADNRLSAELPFVKARALELLEQEVESEEEARELVKQAWDKYAADFPDLEKSNPEAWNAAREFMEERQEFMTDLMVRSQFVDAGEVSWRSFPDHNGHKLDPGCFRCHSGRLQADDGTPITVNCTNCHSIPLVTKRDRVPDHFLSLIDMKKPTSHRDPAFMSKHSELSSEICETCHGDLRFGVSDRTYCSNSGCHGEVWQYLDLDALRTIAAIETAEENEAAN